MALATVSTAMAAAGSPREPAVALVGAPVGFSPKSLPGLKLWLDASQIGGLNDGDPVGTWSDLSGNGNHATQATASKKPTFKVAIINGRAVVRFDGVDDVLVLSGAGLDIAKAVTGLTLIVVSQATLPGTERVAISFTTNAGSGRAAILRESTAAGKLNPAGRRLDADSIQKLAGNGIVTSTWDIEIAVFDYANALGSGYINGAQVIAPTTFQTAGSTSNTSSSAASIGAASDGSESISGDIHAVIACQQALSLADVTRLARYYGTRCALAVA